MSLALTDLLIELSDPRALAKFLHDPEAVMTSFALSDADKEALRSRSGSRIRAQARSTNDSSAYSQFNGSSEPRNEIEVDLEIYNESHDQVAEPERGILFVDEKGQTYVAVAGS
jgi:hypothetical protein